MLMMLITSDSKVQARKHIYSFISFRCKYHDESLFFILLVIVIIKAVNYNWRCRLFTIPDTVGNAFKRHLRDLVVGLVGRLRPVIPERVLDPVRDGYLRAFFGVGERRVPVASLRREIGRTERILRGVDGNGGVTVADGWTPCGASVVLIPLLRSLERPRLGHM